jgi:hypothetical protein
LLDAAAARCHAVSGRNLLQAIGLSLQTLCRHLSPVPDGRITGALGEFPIPTGEFAKLARILHGALLVVISILRSSWSEGRIAPKTAVDLLR